MSSNDSSGESETTSLVTAALRELGIRNLLLAIHDASLPSESEEDLGRGAPGAVGSLRFVELSARLGFTGLQLGPQGQTSRNNPSPYDGTMFSRAEEAVPLSTFLDGSLRGTVSAESLRAARITSSDRSRTNHAHAHAAIRLLLDEAYASIEKTNERGVLDRCEAFASKHHAWLERDSLFAALSVAHGDVSFRAWPTDDRDLFSKRMGASISHERRRALAVRYRRAIDRYTFGQCLAHEAHATFRAKVQEHGLSLHADLQAGMSEVDAWGWQSVLLAGYAMGAPPSRTTSAGQAWGYPVLDPDELWALDVGGAHASNGPGMRLLALRFEKVFAEYDAARIDHPHALVCPWVYRTDIADSGEAVRQGARLFESPDLSDHPALARYAIARPEQIDRALPRHADRWVTLLDEAQVARYGAAVQLLLDVAKTHGRGSDAIAFEVLSTMPYPLKRVMDRLGLGRFRVVQKAQLSDPTDGYRVENARPADWMMLGTHDTPSVWSVVRGLPREAREAWGAYLASVLRVSHEAGAPLACDESSLVHAMLAATFACSAENVMIYFADLFGYHERYNEPGIISGANWSLRLPSSFEALYAERVARGEAIDLRRALALGLESRDAHEPNPRARALALKLRATSR